MSKVTSDEIRRVIILDGTIELYEDGRVFRIYEDGTKELSKMHELKNRGNVYLTASTKVDGKQKHFYPRGEIAKAFVPNPNGFKYVEQIDGNPKNLSACNLRWVSGKEVAQKANRTRLENSPVCIRCGNPMNRGREVCGRCGRAEVIEKESEVRRLKKLIKLKETYANVDVNSFPDDYIEILNERLKGKTLQEISEPLNISREYVRQKLKQMEMNKPPITKSNRLRAKITELNSKIEELENQLKEQQDK